MNMLKSLKNEMKHKNKGNAILCALFPSFTFFVFAPFSLYATNSDEFWFTVWDMLPAMFVGITTAFLLLFCACYFTKGKIQLLVMTLTFAVGLAFYIQGNWLSANFGVLDGKSIQWENYRKEEMISTIVWAVCLIAPFILYLVNSKAQAIFKLIGTFILAIQVVTMGALAINISPKPPLFFSTEKMFELSEDKNTIVFVLDTFDAIYMREILEEAPELLEPFQGFTLFDNTVGSYPTTKGAMPFMLTGQWYENECTYKEYLDKAYTNTSFYEELHDNNYDSRILTKGEFVSTNAIGYIDNLTQTRLQVSNQKKFMQLLNKFVSFRYMPQIIKPYFWMYSGDFDEFKSSADPEKQIASTSNINFLHQLNIQGITSSNFEGAFRVYHLNGVHHPLHMNAKGDVVKPEDTTALEQAKGSLFIVAEYLKQMKEKQIYHDATVVIMADHGETSEFFSQPLFMAKPAGAAQGFAISQAPVSHADLQATLMQGIIADYDKYGISVFDVAEEQERNRRFLQYSWDNSWGSDYMPTLYEYEIDGDSKETGNYKYTGKSASTQGLVLQEVPTITLGEPVKITGQKGDATQYFVSGFSEVEQSSYAWTNGKYSMLAMKVTQKTENPLKLVLTLMPFNDEQKLIVSANGEMLSEQTIAPLAKNIEILVPQEQVIEGTVRLDFQWPNAKPMVDVDPRLLGVAIREIELVETYAVTLNQNIMAINTEQVGEIFKQGLSVPEGDFCWTEGNEAQLNIIFKEQPVDDIFLVLTLLPYNSVQDMVVTTNKEFLGKYTIPAQSREILIFIPKEKIYNQSIALDIEFPNAVSQSELGLGSDTRKLAIAIQSIAFEKASVALGQPVLATDALFTRIFSEGISYLENNFRWTEGLNVHFKMFLSAEPTQDMRLTVGIFPYGGNQRVVAKMGEHILFEEDVSAEATEIVIPIPKNMLHDDVIELDFEFPDAASASELGIGSDQRQTSLAIHNFVLN